MVPLQIRVAAPTGLISRLELHDELRIGRGPHNDVVLAGPQVSWSHAVLRRENDVIVVEDLGSSNGTFVWDTRIARPTRVLGPTPITIGQYAFTRVTGSERPNAPLLVQDLDANLELPLRERFEIGGAGTADLQVVGSPTFVLRPTPDGLDVNGTSVDLPWSPEGCARRISVRRNSAYTPTARGEAQGSILVRLRLDPAQATVVHLPTTSTHTLTAENRVYLLYALARALHDDREAGVPLDECGWRSDDQLTVAIWGRDGRVGSKNRLNTLTHRVRGEVERAGIPRDLIEKRNGWARLNASRVTLDLDRGRGAP
ncbi:MAG: FHA domain-containing protein [Alphaproteobacteria bacterium]|nr:FHA domain-containing protein [Alphaproteobacteria bacterium]MCB9693293.1 FHA domain-containing protein [Alphaproteobacteria bacterium]